MKITDYRLDFVNELNGIYDRDEVTSFFYLVLENKNKLKRLDLALHPELEFSKQEIQVWNFIIEQLKKEIPIQYLLGSTNFYDLEFEVNESVLIPRPETEELVDWIIQSSSSHTYSTKLKILDIGTGSGCIAIVLAKNIANAEVHAIDVSEKALAIAQKNAVSNTVNVTFCLQNILETHDLEQQYDIIVSNPPYVRHVEKRDIKKNVLDYEPHLALFVEDDDPLIFYKKIATLAQKNLTPNGLLYFEINQYLGFEMVQLLESMYFKNIILKKDIYGNDRMIQATV
jgi:release factor glutamine methyltransferase